MTTKQARILALLLISTLAFLPAAYAQQFSDWSAPVNLGPAINTTLYFEQGAAISKDGLSLYFHSNRPGGFGGADIYVSQRPSVDAPWGPPQNLGPNTNTPGTEASPMLSPDGHSLYFQSNRPGGFGGTDLYVSRRHNKRDDFGWQPAENLGSGVNSAAQEQQPWIFEDDTTGITTLYFTSNRPGGLGGSDIYASELQPDETFGPAVLVAELSSPANDGGPTVRRDGLEIIFPSNRPGSLGTLGDDDLWVSTRPSTSDPWSAPVNLGPVVNTVYTDGLPELSFDGTTLYFNSADPTLTSFDLFVTTREKLPGPDDN
jgi:Tol biopolymer transport system component